MIHALGKSLSFTFDTRNRCNFFIFKRTVLKEGNPSFFFKKKNQPTPVDLEIILFLQ